MSEEIKPIILSLTEAGYDNPKDAYTHEYCMTIADIRRLLWDAEPGQPVIVKSDDICHPYYAVDGIKHIKIKE